MKRFWIILALLPCLTVNAAAAGSGSGAGGGFLVAVVIACGIAALICLFLKSRMNTAVRRTNAHEYVTENGVDMRVEQDLYLHTTEHRRRIKSK